MRSFVKEFKDFIASGNVIELAVAVILGAAIAAVVTSFTQGIMMQIVAAIIGQPDFSEWTITLREDVGTDPVTGEPVDATLQIGAFINTLISLVVVGFVLFLIIKSYNHMKARRAAEIAAGDEPVAPTDVELLAEIRDLLAGQRQ